jgi:hypothetical protein
MNPFEYPPRRRPRPRLMPFSWARLANDLARVGLGVILCLGVLYLGGWLR